MADVVLEFCRTRKHTMLLCFQTPVFLSLRIFLDKFGFSVETVRLTSLKKPCVGCTRRLVISNCALYTEINNHYFPQCTTFSN